MLEEKISKLKSEQEAQIKDKVIDRLKKENVMQNYIISQYRKYQKDSSKPDELIISTLNKGPTRIKLKSREELKIEIRRLKEELKHSLEEKSKQEILFKENENAIIKIQITKENNIKTEAKKPPTRGNEGQEINPQNKNKTKPNKINKPIKKNVPKALPLKEPKVPKKGNVQKNPYSVQIDKKRNQIEQLEEKINGLKDELIKIKGKNKNPNILNGS